MTQTLSRMRTAAGAVVSRIGGRRGTARATRTRVVYRPQPLQSWDP